MDRLKLLTSNQIHVDDETQISNQTESDKVNFKQEIQDIFHHIEEAKEKDYAIWHNKIEVSV